MADSPEPLPIRRRRDFLLKVLEMNPDLPEEVDGVPIEEHLSDLMMTIRLNMHKKPRVVRGETEHVWPFDYLADKILHDVLNSDALEGLWEEENFLLTTVHLAAWACGEFTVTLEKVNNVPAVASKLGVNSLTSSAKIETKENDSDSDTCPVPKTPLRKRQRRSKDSGDAEEETENNTSSSPATNVTFEWMSSDFKHVHLAAGSVRVSSSIRTLKNLTTLVLADVGVFAPFREVAFIAPGKRGEDSEPVALGSDRRLLHWLNSVKELPEGHLATLWIVKSTELTNAHKSESYHNAIKKLSAK